MIRFTLNCDHDHSFEGWFRNNDDFDMQSQRNLVECPVCGSAKVGKALMAPAVSTGRAKDARKQKPQAQPQPVDDDSQEVVTLAQGSAQRDAMKQLRELTLKMRSSSEYVGDRFADEARAIHDGDKAQRNIYGEATVEEARSLMDDGIDFMPIPVFPEDQN